jgi:CRISPR/Cas system-associated exonuclease Cas4 (RecB family)
MKPDFSDIISYLEKQDEKSKTIEKIKKDNLFSKNEDMRNEEPLKENLVGTEVVPGFDVSEFKIILRNELLKEYRQSLTWDRPYISVGELFSCKKKVYYIHKKTPIKEECEFKFSYLYLINNIGKELHSIFQKLYKFDEVEKKVIDDEFHVKGRVDAIKRNSLVEIKTIDPKEWKSNYIQNHYDQANIYCYILNSKYKYKINNITIVYVVRDLKTVETFNLKPDFKSARNFLEKGLDIYNCLTLKKIPDNVYNSKSEECNFCSYKYLCKGNNTENSLKDKYIDLLM